MTEPSSDPSAISDAESVVMDVLWRHARPLAADDIITALAPAQDWQEATVKTLLNRLLKKGAVSATAQGRRYLYSAVLQRDDWLHRQSTSLLDRLFGGQVAPLVAHLGRHRKLSKKDLAELKRLIQDMEK